MHKAGYYVRFFVASALLLQQAISLETIIAKFGETIEVPCNRAGAKPAELMFTKWKYDKVNGAPGDLLVKQANKDEVNIQATGSYQGRVSMRDNFDLLITQATLDDQKIFTCMVVALEDIMEYPTKVLVYKTPLPPQIKDKATKLENGKLTAVGECIAMDANPAANITWAKNGQILNSDRTETVITTSVTVDPATGLSTTSSKLQYTAKKEDKDAKFTCNVQDSLGPVQVSAPEIFPIHYPTETVALQVIGREPLREDDNVTLKCQADGNPPPTSFNFHLKGKKVLVENSDTYNLTGIKRDSAGEYKCSLVGNDAVVSTRNISVTYLDVSLSITGLVVKGVGETLPLVLEKNASGEVKVMWTKDNSKLSQQPRFDSLKYSDSGYYVCEVSISGVKQSKSFELLVEGKPKITKLEKKRSEDGKNKVLICHAEGSPKPKVLWNINGTMTESQYVNGKITHMLSLAPSGNLNITCTVYNKLGEDLRIINVSPLFEENEEKPNDRTGDGDDQAKLIVGIVVGLILVAIVAGLAYWLYMKKSRQGSWKTGEKEDGTLEESKKLEENNHKPSV